MEKLGYTFYPKDYISDPDVMMMTPSQRGVYRDLIDLAYMSDNRIKYNLFQLSKYCNASEEEIREILSLKGVNIGEFWSIPSCDKRIAKALVSKENGKKGGRPKNPTKTQEQTQTEPKPKGKEKEKEKEKGNRIENKEENNIPSFDLFKEFAITHKPNVDVASLKLKYESWKVNGWKTGGDKPRPIKNWKTTLLNTLDHLKESSAKVNSNFNYGY